MINRCLEIVSATGRTFDSLITMEYFSTEVDPVCLTVLERFREREAISFMTLEQFDDFIAIILRVREQINELQMP